MIIYLYLT